MDGIDENSEVVTEHTNFQEMGNRRVLRDIKNLVGTPPCPGAVIKKTLTENYCINDKKPAVVGRRPITRKYSAASANKPRSRDQVASEKHGCIVQQQQQSPPPLPISLPYSPISSTEIVWNDDMSAKNLPQTVVEENEELGNFEHKEVEMVDVQDIDSFDSDNPLAAVEYVEDIYRFYREIEVDGCVHPDYMSHQSDINERMRAILVDWLIDVHYKFELMHETLFLTVNTMDRFLERQSVVRKKLQLVGVTAMLLACKYEEVCVPVVEDLILISDRAYTRKEVLEMEKQMVNTLQFNMSVPTPYVFMRRFLKAAQSDDRQLELLSFFIVELCLVEYQMLKFCPSLLAAAAVYTAQCSLKGYRRWTRTSELHTSYSEDQLLECSRLMVDFHKNAGAAGKLTGVRRKYSSLRFGCAAGKSRPALFLLEPGICSTESE